MILIVTLPIGQRGRERAVVMPYRMKFLTSLLAGL